MSGIATVVEELLLATVISEKILMPRKSKADWALIGLSALLGSMGVFLAALGLDRFLEERYPPDLAAMITAGLLFAAAFVSAAVAYFLRRQRALKLAEERNEFGKNILSLLDEVCSELNEPVRESPKTAVMLAALAGFFVARHRI